MREIKFRVWDKVAKRMSSEFSLFGEFLLLGAIHSWQEESGVKGGSLERLGDLEVMQFTGLIDRNGKEIYEGDVLKSFSSTGSVTFENGTFLWKNDPLGWDMDDEFEICLPEKWATVIGHIYENPETA